MKNNIFACTNISFSRPVIFSYGSTDRRAKGKVNCRVRPKIIYVPEDRQDRQCTAACKLPPRRLTHSHSWSWSCSWPGKCRRHSWSRPDNGRRRRSGAARRRRRRPGCRSSQPGRSRRPCGWRLYTRHSYHSSIQCTGLKT